MSQRKKFLVVFVVLAVVGGTLAGSKRTDAEILTRVGQTTVKKVRSAMPDASALAGPLVALTPTDLLPVADRVRLRVKTDKIMDGATVNVTATASGEVTLRGEVASAVQRTRAVELAQSTTGVTRVVPELTEPAK